MSIRLREALDRRLPVDWIGESAFLAVMLFVATLCIAAGITWWWTILAALLLEAAHFWTST